MPDPDPNSQPDQTYTQSHSLGLVLGVSLGPIVSLGQGLVFGLILVLGLVLGLDGVLGLRLFVSLGLGQVKSQ